MPSRRQVLDEIGEWSLRVGLALIIYVLAEVLDNRDCDVVWRRVELAKYVE